MIITVCVGQKCKKKTWRTVGHNIQKSSMCTIRCDTTEWTRKELVEGSRLMMQMPVQGGGAVRFDELLLHPPPKWATIVPHQAFLPHFTL